ncbi:MAG: type II secretion system GspH family protein [Lachnospiraceae bacterium]|nr:type II secretion system GspH family protein [Lachnospiraceae bacterium]MDE6233421.1 type II secretion system GspH family protein [Lachnospiraceae bacterium]MDE6253736.1 type II secretion system GspH family protein [Lachnospiraceae bacterium]
MKKITKNNKGFSLIELIIVIAIMAVLVAIIAPNLTKYLGSSKKNTDKKNADELAAQIQNCISDFESTDGNPYLGACTIAWSGATATVTGGGAPAGTNKSFQTLLNDAITSATESKETGGNASATIALKGTDASEGYTITVKLGNANVTR